MGPRPRRRPAPAASSTPTTGAAPEDRPAGTGGPLTATGPGPTGGRVGLTGTCRRSRAGLEPGSRWRGRWR
ncbi:hypothetical protein ACFFX0_24675 [Citricoccus parietis]|uniref:Uncharacterized protein n=1 Tax=Citricoccus parietis TaxID=592307 RepID=A0ABV5G5J9_9MICC